eukprot:g5762.t1 g5762   contig20:112204-112725(+)
MLPTDILSFDSQTGVASDDAIASFPNPRFEDTDCASLSTPNSSSIVALKRYYGRRILSLAFTHNPYPMFPPDTVDTITLDEEFVEMDDAMEGYVSTIALQAHAAPIAPDIPPPEKAIPMEMLFLFVDVWLPVLFLFTTVSAGMSVMWCSVSNVKISFHVKFFRRLATRPLRQS